MNPKSSLPQWRAMRLRSYDYSQPGAYFVSICAQHRKCLFGTIIDGQMRLNEIGEIVVECWSRIPQHFPSVELGEYVIMPNHIHGIIASNIVGARSPRPIEAEHSTPPTVGARSPRPIEAEHSTPPTVGARSPRPIEAEHSTPPTVGARSPRPIEAEHSTPPTVGARSPRPLDNSPSLGKIVAYFKYQSTKHINQHHNTPGTRIWQRNYYDHVIRDDTDLQRIRQYIQDNPMKWALDQLHPDNPSKW